jgi:hypothetical protein
MSDLNPQWLHCGTPQAEPDCPPTSTTSTSTSTSTSVAPTTTTTEVQIPLPPPSTGDVTVCTWTDALGRPVVLNLPGRQPCPTPTTTTTSPKPTTSTTAAVVIGQPVTVWPCPIDAPVRLEDNSCVKVEYGAPRQQTTTTVAVRPKPSHPLPDQLPVTGGSLILVPIALACIGIGARLRKVK